MGDEADKDKSLRLFRENYWIKELKTMYPYGLNERSSDGDATKNIENIYATFNKLNRKKNRFSNIDFLAKTFSIFKPKKIIKLAMQIYWNNDFWVNQILSLLNRLNNKHLNLLKNFINIRIKTLNININVYNIIYDFINYRLVFKHNKAKNDKYKNNTPIKTLLQN